jgi:hypothetical protein
LTHLHFCKASRCAATIRSGSARPVLMCARHWLMVPDAIRSRMYHAAKDHARIEDASDEYLEVAAEAIEAVARLEGAPVPNAFRTLLNLRAGATPGQGGAP